ncbi:MAG: hypothetical protein HY961_13310 [Ignavibacteriae bacterium]|nr:hypothetical protein [Ignavibacteriota bacterium]
MTAHSPAFEFEGYVDANGAIAVPTEMVDALSGKKLHVRIQQNEIASSLRKKMVTEDEIARIAATQLEQRDQAVKFLLSEGSLKSNRAFSRRSKGKHG